MLAEHKWTLRGKIAEVEAEFDLPLKLVCLPLYPAVILSGIQMEMNMEPGWDYDFRMEVGELLESQAAEYPSEVTDLVSGSQPPQTGQSFDISLSRLFGDTGSLVRKNGEVVALGADTFRDKRVMVCCFYAPVVYGTEPATDFQDILNFCQQYTGKDYFEDIEVVMVAWINGLVDSADHKKVFDHFFSAFPASCLAVPFEDILRRAYLCNLLAGTTSDDFINSHCLFLDPQGIVLPSFRRDKHHFFDAEAYPFAEDYIKCLEEEDRELMEYGRLQDFLRSHPYRFNPEGAPEEFIDLNDLALGLVGLYMPLAGDLIPSLVNIHEQCRNQELQFDILVVYRGPQARLNQLRIEWMMRNHDTCRLWWCSPLDISVSLRFWRLTSQDAADRLLVLGQGPCGDFLDFYADTVIKKHGVAGYPFSRQAMFLRDITLESVLLGDDAVRGNNAHDFISPEMCRGKEIHIYFSSLSNKDSYITALAYNKRFPDSEVIFVPLMDGLEEVEPHDEMPWYICTFNPARIASFCERFRIDEAMIRFGEDGRACSCRYTFMSDFDSYIAYFTECFQIPYELQQSRDYRRSY